MKLFKLIKNNYMNCPICKGEGGYTEKILDDGSGPYYPCYYCDDIGKISLFKLISYYFGNIYYNLLNKIKGDY